MVGDLLFGDVEFGGDVFVGPAADEEEFGALDFPPFAFAAPAVDLIGHGGGEGLRFQVAALAAAEDGAGGAVAAGEIPLAAGAGFAGRKGQGGAAAFAAQVIGEFVSGDRKEVAFERASGIVVGQAIEEADEGFLNDIFGGVAAMQAAFDEGQQAAFEARDQFVPGGFVAGANLIDE